LHRRIRLKACRRLRDIGRAPAFFDQEATPFSPRSKNITAAAPLKSMLPPPTLPMPSSPNFTNGWRGCSNLSPANWIGLDHPSHRVGNDGAPLALGKVGVGFQGDILQ
jgi:hypothetical protein